MLRQGFSDCPQFLFSGYKLTSDAEECVDGSQRGRRPCISQHEQDLTMEQTLIVMVLVFFTRGPTTVLVSSLLVVAHRIICQADIRLSSYSLAYMPPQSRFEL